MVPIYPGMAQHFAPVPQQQQQQQQHQQQQQTGGGQHQHVPHVAQGGGGQGGNQGGQRGGVPHHVTPSPSPGLGAPHPGIPTGVPGSGHGTPGAAPFEPRQHLPNQATGGGVNATTGGPPVQGVVPVPGTVGGLGIHPGHVPGQPSNLVPVVTVPAGPYVKRERKVALIQDPNTMETIDLEQLGGGRRSGTSTPKPAGGAVSDTSASSSGAVTPSGGQATKESTPTPGSVTSEKISAPSNAKDARSSKEGTPIAPSLTESNNNSNKNNSNLGNKSNFNVST